MKSSNDIVLHNLKTEDLKQGIIAIKTQEFIMNRMGKSMRPQLTAEYEAYVQDLTKTLSTTPRGRVDLACFILSIDAEVQVVLAKLKKF